MCQCQSLPHQSNKVSLSEDQPNILSISVFKSLVLKVFCSHLLVCNSSEHFRITWKICSQNAETWIVSLVNLVEVIQDSALVAGVFKVLLVV